MGIDPTYLAILWMAFGVVLTVFMYRFTRSLFVGVALLAFFAIGAVAKLPSSILASSQLGFSGAAGAAQNRQLSAQVERLINTHVPALAIVFAEHPEQKQEFLDAVVEAYEGGGVELLKTVLMYEAVDLMDRHFTDYFVATYYEAAVQLGAADLEVLRAVEQRSTGLCYDVITDAVDMSELFREILSPEQNRKYFNAFNRVFVKRNYNESNRAKWDKPAADLDRVIARVEQRLGPDGYMAVVTGLAGPARAAACRTYIVLLEEILALPPREGAGVLKYLVSGGYSWETRT